MKPQPVLQATDIIKDLGQGAGKVRALKGVSLTVSPGQLTLLMGPSGSGKTTLLSILGCILTPTSGSLTLGGEKADGLDPEELAELRRRHIGFVFQTYNLYPTLTSEENVRLALDVPLPRPRRVEMEYSAEFGALASRVRGAIGSV